MILSLAVGGHSGGNASVSEFPAMLAVDYAAWRGFEGLKGLVSSYKSPLRSLKGCT